VKRYRYFRSHRYLKETFHPRIKILKVPFLSLYVLLELSVFRLGDREDKNYHPVDYATSIFSFKEHLKQKSIIRNLYRQDVEFKNNLKKAPQWWQDFVRKREMR